MTDKSIHNTTSYHTPSDNPLSLSEDELVVLHTIAPLSKYQQLKIWFALKKQLNIGVFNRLRVLIRTLFATLLAVILGLSTLTTSANVVVLEAEQTGWNAEIDTDTMELSIQAVSPMAVEKDEYCVMWLKMKGKKAIMLAKLPMKGEMNMKVSSDVVDMIADAMVIISVENSKDVTHPGRVEYMREPDD